MKIFQSISENIVKSGPPTKEDIKLKKQRGMGVRPENVSIGVLLRRTLKK